jgi:cytochrome P450/NADPH-cytochrome P450 reductase
LSEVLHFTKILYLPLHHINSIIVLRQRAFFIMAAIDTRDTVPIPQPRGLPIVGNLSSIDPALPFKSFQNLAAEHGEIYALNLLGQRRIFINTVALASEACDERRFDKEVAAGLKELRHGLHDGLFTAFPGEHNWEIAHRVLVPAFGPLKLNGMFSDMKDIASQLVLKWARYGPSYRIPAAEDFTRLTLGTDLYEETHLNKSMLTR